MNAYQRIDEADAPSELLSVAEAARVLRISQSTLWRWIDRGEVPAYRIGPKRVWLKKAELDSLNPHVRLPRDDGAKAPEMAEFHQGRMSAAKSARVLQALDRARVFREKLLADRGGRLFERSEDDLYELREERSRQLS